MVRLATVSPCYNEEEVLYHSVERLTTLFERMISEGLISSDSMMVFVNDGSRDRTWEIICELHEKNKFVRGINMSRNVGHQNAIMAGMMTAREWADAVITIDADLQDDIECIPKMVKDFEAGNDIVYGVKVSREADPYMKKMTAQAFYKLQDSMGVESIYNHADFRLMSRRALDMLSSYKEHNLYLRGLIPLIGLKHTTVDDVISERFAGQSKYTLHKMLRLALNGITAFSVRPLFLIYNIGIFFLVVAFFIACYVGYSLVSGHVVPGWSSLILSIWIVGGFILISLGIVGTYIGQIYTEVKRRPLYHIQEILMAVAAMMAVTGVQAQIPRSDAFRAKYELKEVVVMSRHNIRSPLTSGGAAYMRVTPHEWFKWTSPSSQLSLRGGVNETAMGQFFRKWVVGEGLLPDNYRPEGDEVLFYANSRQRTFATAKYFSAGFLPFANVEITHKLAEDKMDPVFTAQFTKMNNTYRQQVLSEIMALNGGPQAWMQSVQPTLTLMEQVLDMAHSPAALQGDTTHFRYDDIQFKLEKGSEPKMTGGYTLANSVADALVLQCYESESMTAFGHELSTEQWRDICKVKAVYDGLLFTTHAAAVNLAYPLVSRIREELNRTDRKFMFLCGHDSNLASISAALRFNFPETKDAFENRTPIGSKLVFEKWSDGSDTFVAINLVYASVDQLQNRTLLSTDVPPMVLPVTVEGLSANEDGLYRLTDLDARFGETIAEYDAIEDDPTAISSATRSVSVTDGRAYTLNGVVANDSTRGLVIQNGQKIIRK